MRQRGAPQASSLVFFAWGQRSAAGGLKTELRQYRRKSLGISILTPMAYLFVLFAKKLDPVSRAAPVREMFVIIGAFPGARLLRGGHAVRRTVAVALIALGVVALTLS